METRTILQIILGVVVSAVVLIGVLIVYELTRSPETIVETQFEEVEREKTVEKNKWEDREDEAIGLVEKEPVGEMSDGTRRLLELEEDEETTIGAALEHSEFVAEKLNIAGTEPVGWEAEWWGETKYGDHYYQVRYAFEDVAITIGPTWLVSLEKEKVVPKNVTAQVATMPDDGDDSEYYDKSREVVSAMTKHTFDNGLTLAAALILYFNERAETQGEDTILGWTIQHEREQMFRAYFQWREKDETTYAEFEFDYERKALKPVNLHAGNFMREGEDFEKIEPVDILPKSFNPDATRASERWTGRAAEAYENPKHRQRFEALGTVLSQEDLISSLEWLLRAQAKTAEEFEQCKKPQGGNPPKCRWKPEKQEADLYRVTYEYDLGDGAKKIQWDVDLSADEDPISPVGRVSKLAYRVVFPRE